MDLSLLDSKKGANEGRELIIVNPATGLETDIMITLAGIDSDIYQAIDREAARKRFKLLSRRQELKLTPEEIEEERLDMLAKCTLGWSGLQENGQDMPYSYANARRIYQNYPVIRRQVDQFIGDQSNFLASSPQN